MHEGPDNLLFFHTGSIGEFLMDLYLAEQFRESNPCACVRIVMPRNAEFLRGFLHPYPYITIIEISKWKLWRLPHLFKQQRGLAVIIHPTIGHIPTRIKILGWLLTRRQGSTLIGFWDRGPLCSLYSKMLRYDAETPYHETLDKVARALGVEPSGVPILLFEPRPEVLAAYGLQKGEYIVIHPGASTPARSFDTETVVDLIRYANAHAPNLRIVLSGSEADRVLLKQIEIAVGDVTSVIGSSAEEIGTIVEGARLYIGVDTGISHLACFLGVPAIIAAHESTQINWLPRYARTARILYRLKEEDAVRSEWDYLIAHRKGRIQPFGRVPSCALIEALGRALA